jgi:tape measure domain-containing protein
MATNTDVLRTIVRADGTENVVRAFGTMGSAATAAEQKIQRMADRAALISNVAGGMSMAAMGAAGGMIRLAGAAEQAQIAFTTLLKSPQAAKQHLSELADFAAKTPFEFTGLRTLSTQLLAFGFQAKSVIPMLRTLGDAGSALGQGPEGLSRIIRAMGQMKAKGRLQQEEVLQLAESGIPVFQILQKELGLTGAQVGDIGRQGISAEKGIAALLRGMQSMYGGGMDAQSKTLNGSISNMVDQFTLAGQEVGGEFIPSINSATKSVTGLIEQFRGLSPSARHTVAVMLGIGAVAPLMVSLYARGVQLRAMWQLNALVKQRSSQEAIEAERAEQAAVAQTVKAYAAKGEAMMGSLGLSARGAAPKAAQGAEVIARSSADLAADRVANAVAMREASRRARNVATGSAAAEAAEAAGAAAARRSAMRRATASEWMLDYSWAGAGGGSTVGRAAGAAENAALASAKLVAAEYATAAKTSLLSMAASAGSAIKTGWGAALGTAGTAVSRTLTGVGGAFKSLGAAVLGVITPMNVLAAGILAIGYAYKTMVFDEQKKADTARRDYMKAGQGRPGTTFLWRSAVGGGSIIPKDPLMEQPNIDEWMKGGGNRDPQAAFLYERLQRARTRAPKESWYTRQITSLEMGNLQKRLQAMMENDVIKQPIKTRLPAGGQPGAQLSPDAILEAAEAATKRQKAYAAYNATVPGAANAPGAASSATVIESLYKEASAHDAVAKSLREKAAIETDATKKNSLQGDAEKQAVEAINVRTEAQKLQNDVDEKSKKLAEEHTKWLKEQRNAQFDLVGAAAVYFESVSDKANGGQAHSLLAQMYQQEAALAAKAQDWIAAYKAKTAAVDEYRKSIEGQNAALSNAMDIGGAYAQYLEAIGNEQGANAYRRSSLASIAAGQAQAAFGKGEVAQGWKLATEAEKLAMSGQDNGAGMIGFGSSSGGALTNAVPYGAEAAVGRAIQPLVLNQRIVVQDEQGTIRARRRNDERHNYYTQHR